MKLNIGCGENKISGYINVDKRIEAKPDMLVNIGEELFPIDDNKVTEILSHNSFEHFPNFIDVVNELARISTNGCIWKITVPYATSYMFNVINPYHVNPWFTEDTFRFWDDVYKREQPSWFKLNILKTEFVYNTKLWGKNNDWNRLRKTNINVVMEMYQEIKVIK